MKKKMKCLLNMGSRKEFGDLHESSGPDLFNWNQATPRQDSFIFLRTDRVQIQIYLFFFKVSVEPAVFSSVGKRSFLCVF